MHVIGLPSLTRARPELSSLQMRSHREKSMYVSHEKINSVHITSYSLYVCLERSWAVSLSPNNTLSDDLCN